MSCAHRGVVDPIRGRTLPLLLIVFLTGTSVPLAAQQSDADARNEASLPLFLRYDTGGVDSITRGIQFSPDSETLYIAGWNKVVQVYLRDADSGRYEYTPVENYRVPIGQGRFGMLECLAVSPDGRWLAAAGAIGAGAVASQEAWVWPRSETPEDVLSEIGSIYVFDTRTHRCRVLRGHQGTVRQLQFVDGEANSDTLVSVALENDGDSISQSVRVWSVQNTQQLSEPLTTSRSILPNGVELPPRIRAWSAPDGTPIVAVSNWTTRAGALQSDLRLWRPLSGDPDIVLDDAPVGMGIELLRSGESLRLFCGGLGPDTFYRLEGATVAGRTSFGGSGLRQTPFAAAQFQTAGNAAGTTRALAVCIEPQTNGELEYSLHRITESRRSRVGGLWANSPRPGFTNSLLIEPKIAASPDRKTVAVSGASDNTVWLLSGEQISAAQNARAQLRPFQILNSAAVVAQSAVFVKNDTQSGIAVSDWVGRSRQSQDKGNPAAASMVLNSADGSLTERSNDWQDAVAAQGDWRAVSSDDRQQVEVTNTARGSSVQLSLPQDFRTPGVRYEVTTFAVCNALNDNPPLAAVAMHLQGDPILCIFDAANGSFLRMCDGHSRRISSLSFSEDGELLVSASLDGTLKVWLVEDLDERTVGEVGWLPGLIVADGDDTAEVVRLEDGSDAAAAGIQVGDIIEGAVTDFGLEPFSSAGEFYQFVSQTSPDRSPQLTLRVVRGNDRRDIALPVQQGADMRQPLLSVLLDQSQDAEAEDGTNWLVWTPDGRFDLKGQSLRGRLGWHINTGNDVSPVSYSSVDQYATRFRQQGLLTDLLGAAHSARNEPVTPEMRVSLVAENGQIIEPNYDDELVLRQIRGRLVVDFNEGAGDVIDQAEWTIAGGQALPLTRIDRDMWAVDLEMTDLGRGPHNVVVSMATDEDPPLVLRQSMSLRYQPPAPELTLLAPVRSLTNVDRDALSIRFQADVAVPATVTLQHTADDATVQEVSIPISASGEFEQSVTLNSGANRIRLIAVNDGIPDHLSRFVEEEQTRLELEANYIPAGPPVIRIDQIQDTARQQPLTMIDGQFVTESSELLLQGTIQATIPLSQTAIRHTERTPPQSLEGFAADSTTEFAFRELVTLVPGQQIIELSASAGNESATTTVPVMFRPALPILKLVQPETDRVRERVTADNVDIRFVARVSSDTAFPFTAVVQVDGATVSDPSIQYDANSRTLSGTVSLPADPSRNPDSHVLQIALENEWGARSETGFTAHLLHPPVLSSVQLLRDERSNSADLTCTVDVPPLRPVTQVHVSINDQVLPDLPFETEGVDGPATTIRIPQLPLQPGVNQIVVRLANNDGESAARSIEENVVRPSLPPTVKLAEPLTDLTTMLPSQRLQFKVYSEPGLQRVDVVIRADRRRPQRIALWPRGQESEQNLARTFERRLPLAAGLNEVEIIVQNRGGVVRRRLDLTYLPPPVSLTVDQLVAIDDSWSVEARADEYGAIQFPAAAHDGNAILHGTIGWLPGHRPHGDLWTVRVWVNGFLRSAEIPAPGPAAESARFAVPVVLNQTQNRLRIESPEISFSEERLAMADNSLPRFRQVEVDCEQPERRQRLHLVMMGVEIEDGANVASADELQAFANAALQLEAQSSAFEQVRRYAPLVGESAVGRRLRSLMSLVSGDVARRTGRNQINDVVMFYYRGREHWSDDGQFILEDFQNYENPVQHSQSVSEEYLAELFRDLPGAHVVFLDVQNAERSRLTTSRWPQFPNLGLFRIAWSGRAPNPLPPGPLFSTVRDAIGRVDNEDVLRLRRLESAFHTQLGIDADDDRFRVETYVPEDLADLIVARLTAAAGTPGGNR